MSLPILVFSDWRQPFMLHTDASEMDAAGTLIQTHEGVSTGYAIDGHVQTSAILTQNTAIWRCCENRDTFSRTCGRDTSLSYGLLSADMAVQT